MADFQLFLMQILLWNWMHVHCWDFGMLKKMPFTELKISVWFGFYDCLKFAQNECRNGFSFFSSFFSRDFSSPNLVHSLFVRSWWNFVHVFIEEFPIDYISPFWPNSPRRGEIARKIPLWTIRPILIIFGSEVLNYSPFPQCPSCPPASDGVPSLPPTKGVRLSTATGSIPALRYQTDLTSVICYLTYGN